MTRISKRLAGLPLWVFLAVYVITCAGAAVPLALDYRPLKVMVDYFAGVNVPARFDATNVLTFWTMLIAAPLAMALGYAGAYRLAAARLQKDLNVSSTEPDHERLALWTFALSSCIALFSLYRGDVLQGIHSWWDYGAWVQVRWSLFAKLGYFEFTNLYVWLPVSTAWLLCTYLSGQRKMLWRVLVVLFIACALTLMLYQKKSLVALLLLVLFAAALHRVMTGRWDRAWTKGALAALAGLVVIYLSMTVLPVWRDTTTKLKEIDNVAKENLAKENLTKRDRQAETARKLDSIIGEARAAHVAVYALLSPFTRTSLPTFYYVEVFPQKHPFYGLDLAQDVLGYGNMPDDNRVVWRAMYPTIPGGSASAPFHFILYSQVGIAGALLGAAFTGAVLALAWAVLLAWRQSAVTRSLLGALLLVFSIYLAIDSTRNSLISSYGLLWGVALVGVLHMLGQIAIPQKRGMSTVTR